jgi:hypothetical protein
MSGETAPAKHPRGRPRKNGEQLRRDRANSHLENLQVWFMVESKRKGVVGMSVKRACELIVAEAISRREAAPKITQELLDANQKYLFDAGTLRRRHAKAEALRRQDHSIAEHCARVLAQIGPWESTIRRRAGPRQ